MNTTQNKATAHRFFELFSASDVDGVLALMTDDATWQLLGKKELMPTAGIYNKDRLRRLFLSMQGSLVNGLDMKVTSCLAEGDSVALEVVSAGELKNGRQYRQQYHFLMQFRDGKVCVVREYLDTHHAYDVWMAKVSSQEASGKT